MYNVACHAKSLGTYHDVVEQRHAGLGELLPVSPAWPSANHACRSNALPTVCQASRHGGYAPRTPGAARTPGKDALFPARDSSSLRGSLSFRAPRPLGFSAEARRILSWYTTGAASLRNDQTSQDAIHPMLFGERGQGRWLCRLVCCLIRRLPRRQPVV